MKSKSSVLSLSGAVAGAPSVSNGCRCSGLAREREHQHIAFRLYNTHVQRELSSTLPSFLSKERERGERHSAFCVHTMAVADDRAAQFYCCCSLA